MGRVLTLMRRHLAMDEPHLWVVYPRCRESEHLHLQIAGIWEPSTLSPDQAGADDSLTEGDDFFSVRGELIYTKPETGELVVKIRQQPRADGSRPLPFKIQAKGTVPLEHLRHFVSLELRRQGQALHLERFEVIAPMPSSVKAIQGRSRPSGHRTRSIHPEKRPRRRLMEEGQGSTGALRRELPVAVVTGLGAFGPAIGISPAWIVILVGGGLVALSVDAATWRYGGHVLAEALPEARPGCDASLCMKPAIS